MATQEKSLIAGITERTNISITVLLAIVGLVIWGIRLEGLANNNAMDIGDLRQTDKEIQTITTELRESTIRLQEATKSLENVVVQLQSGR